MHLKSGKITVDEEEKTWFWNLETIALKNVKIMFFFRIWKIASQRMMISKNMFFPDIMDLHPTCQKHVFFFAFQIQHFCSPKRRFNYFVCIRAKTIIFLDFHAPLFLLVKPLDLKAEKTWFSRILPRGPEWLRNVAKWFISMFLCHFKLFECICRHF